MCTHLQMLPRYSNRPFPAYRFVPGKNPHPTRDRDGHSYNEEPELVVSFDVEDWNTCELYLYGIDLFNHGFWWEAHEALEAVWMAAGRRTESGLFIQGIIQIAVAHLKEIQGFQAAAKKMAWKGLDKLGHRKDCYLGIDVITFHSAVKASFSKNPVTPVTIELRHHNQSH